MLHFRFRWLLGHIVGEQDDSQAGRFALDQLEFGQIHAIVEKAFSASHDHGMQHQPVLIVANAPIPTAAVPWSWRMFDFTQLPNALC